VHVFLYDGCGTLVHILVLLSGETLLSVDHINEVTLHQAKLVLRPTPGSEPLNRRPLNIAPS